MSMTATEAYSKLQKYWFRTRRLPTKGDTGEGEILYRHYLVKENRDENYLQLVKLVNEMKWDERLEAFCSEHDRMPRLPKKAESPEEASLYRHYVRGENKTELWRKKEAYYREKERSEFLYSLGKEICEETQKMIEVTGFFPRQSAPSEKALADRINNNYGNLHPEHRACLDELKAQFSVKSQYLTPSDRLRLYRQACELKELNAAYTPSKEEKDAASWLSAAGNRAKLSDRELAEYVSLAKTYGRYKYEDPAELLTDFEEFVKENLCLPDAKSKDAREARIARSVPTFMKSGQFDLDQQEKVNQTIKAYAKKKTISVSEKILAGALSLVFSGKLAENEIINGHNVDCVIRHKGKTYCVEYDGAVHKNEESCLRDRRADEKCLDAGTSVIRVREPKAHDYKPLDPRVTVVKICKELRSMDDSQLHETVCEVIRHIDSDLAEKTLEGVSFDWLAIRKGAQTKCSTRADVIDAVVWLVRYALIKGELPSRKHRRVIVVENFAKLNLLTPADMKLLDMLENGFGNSGGEAH